MQPGCYGARNLVAVRASRLNDDGTRICPNVDGSAYLRGGAIRFGASTDVDAGDTDVQRDGDGNVCNTRSNPDVVTGVSLELELCIFDFEMIEILTGGVLGLDGATTIGIEYPGASDTPPPCRVSRMGPGLGRWRAGRGPLLLSPRRVL